MVYAQEIRVAVRELDTTGREILLVLQQIHQEDGLNQSKLLHFLLYYAYITIKGGKKINKKCVLQLEIFVPKLRLV